MAENGQEIILIGCGISGLIITSEISARGGKVTVLEGSDYIGGRIKKVEKPGFSNGFETGAEFIHGDLPLTVDLVRKAGAEKLRMEGDIWERTEQGLHRLEDFVEQWSEVYEKLGELEEDMSLKAFFEEYFPGEAHKPVRYEISRMVEGYLAGDIEFASAKALLTEFQEDEISYRIKGGYGNLVNYLLSRIDKNNCAIHLNSRVTEINWAVNKVEVKCKNESVYQGNKLVITVPLGILQQEQSSDNYIKFNPAITEKLAAAKRIGFGSVIKVGLEFSEPVWEMGNKELKNPGFIFSSEEVPTWWTQLPNPSGLITGWLAGPKANSLAKLSDEEIISRSIKSLSTILTIPETLLQSQLKATQVANWVTNPFTQGAYSYASLGGKKAREYLAEPIQETIYFSGEGVDTTGPTGTVEAAIAAANKTVELITGNAKTGT
jgi:monoamine oxidase